MYRAQEAFVSENVVHSEAVKLLSIWTCTIVSRRNPRYVLSSVVQHRRASSFLVMFSRSELQPFLRALVPAVMSVVLFRTHNFDTYLQRRLHKTRFKVPHIFIIFGLSTRLKSFVCLVRLFKKCETVYVHFENFYNL